MKVSVGPKSPRLSFPNRSRNFDAKRHRVCFWGYAGAIEISFFVEAGALQKLDPEMSGTEAESLRAFDAARERIHEVADKVYGASRSGSYAFTLAAADF